MFQKTDTGSFFIRRGEVVCLHGGPERREDGDSTLWVGSTQTEIQSVASRSQTDLGLKPPGAALWLSSALPLVGAQL